MVRLKCIRNDSKSIKLNVNQTYECEHVGGGFYRIDVKGDKHEVMAHLSGKFLDFVEVK